MTRPTALIAALVLTLTACGPDDEVELDPDTGDAADEDVADEDVADEDVEDEPGDAPDGDAAAKEEPGDTVTLLTHDSFDVSEDVLAAFTDDTGVDVEVVPLGDAGTALNQTILTADAPQGDLLFGVDNTFLSRALDEDIFEAYESPALDQVDEDLILDDEHRVTPVDRGDVCLNYDVAFFEDADVDVPEDLSDLADPAYEGLLGVTNPATSSPGLAFLLATIETFGEDGYLDFWEQLVDNDVIVTDGWSEVYYDEFSATSDGDRPLVVSYASSPPAEVLFAEEELDDAPTGVIEASCFRQIEFVGILDGTENRAGAELLVDFMLSETFQEDIPLTMFVFPANQQAQLPEVFEEFAVLPDEPLEIDHEVVGEHREEWIEAWTSTVLR